MNFSVLIFFINTISQIFIWIVIASALAFIFSPALSSCARSIGSYR